jgi:hypothetical protein
VSKIVNYIVFIFPVSLKAMCRGVILEKIDKNDVPMLPLPNLLKEYLTYNGDEDCVSDKEVGDEED